MATTGRSAQRRAEEPVQPKTPAPPSQTLAEHLRAAIEADIIEGGFKPGQKLDEAVLALRFDVSRTPVREALRALAATGLVAFQPRLGAIVASPTAGEVIDLFELVAELEGVAARLAAERMDEADAAAIIAAHEACRAAAGTFDPARYYAVNGQFHGAIRRAARNPSMDHEIEILDKRLSPYRRFITFRPGRTETAMREHEAIAAALVARQGEQAARAMRDHVKILGEDVLALVKSLRV